MLILFRRSVGALIKEYSNESKTLGLQEYKLTLAPSSFCQNFCDFIPKA